MQANNRSFYKKLSLAPPELKIFALFALLVTIVSISIIFFIKGELLISYGKILENSTTHGYWNATIFIFMLINHTKFSRPTALRLGIAALMIFTILFNIIKFSSDRNQNDVTIVQIIWSIVIPVFWVGLLFTKRMNRYCALINLKR